MNLHWKAHKRLLFGSLLGVALVAAVACGSDDDDGAAPAATPGSAATAAPADPAQPAATSAPADPAATAAPGDAPATAAPSAPAEATTSPATGADDVVPSGETTIAVNAINAGTGTPRFCSAGCAEDVYITGIMETLFRPIYGDTLGAQPEEGILASSFELDPNLKWLDFTLREGIQFHDGWGEFTAQDVVFSYNDANRNTQPESIHGQAGDFAPLIKNFEILDTYKVRMNYENYDSRGIRHRFSTFWQTAGIVSAAVFDSE
ncbi:MAG: hypothetical protein IIC92_13125, partial [Chloroflexi bacterium]|nr:hypothetical protein [Chloroflexota bacterium]